MYCINSERDVHNRASRRLEFPLLPESSANHMIFLSLDFQWLPLNAGTSGIALC